jgi:hypothetical protein
VFVIIVIIIHKSSPGVSVYLSVWGTLLYLFEVCLVKFHISSTELNQSILSQYLEEKKIFFADLLKYSWVYKLQIRKFLKILGTQIGKLSHLRKARKSNIICKSESCRFALCRTYLRPAHHYKSIIILLVFSATSLHSVASSGIELFQI